MMKRSACCCHHNYHRSVPSCPRRQSNREQICLASCWTPEDLEVLLHRDRGSCATGDLMVDRASNPSQDDTVDGTCRCDPFPDVAACTRSYRNRSYSAKFPNDPVFRGDNAESHGDPRRDGRRHSYWVGCDQSIRNWNPS